MELKQGTREDHIGTLKRAKVKGICSLWSGDLTRNRYLVENVDFAVSEGFISFPKLVVHHEAQMSNWEFEWLKDLE